MFDKENVDYDAFYRGEPVLADMEVPYPKVPWDLGEPQPAVVELADTVDFADEILDAGCGPGDNTIMLAQRGHHVTGIDCSPTALARARADAQAAGVNITFVESDATKLAEFASERFATVLDSALYHCLADVHRRQYVAALHRVTRPGAQLHLVCWAKGTPGARHPMGVAPENLETIVGTHWDITEIRSTTLTTSLVRDALTDADLTQFAQVGVVIDREAVEIDAKGRIMGPAWYLHATRR
ncbi:methyltransferase domain-containing protein [Yinghuangia sp. ASG 101]|uniref:class I SAM-dependent methyltransferase n=1 Tax=Yinghuangia sp. ASG 101 TaxID=2896848 RepID=UPI001E379EDF|nr:class I SAM-dependent methyltransferase [Yinghuangia sp. ASG 101]UGQ12645.1 methyltransferase domain-containing protein [Yinghuangia sp. ASG 101]